MAVIRFLIYILVLVAIFYLIMNFLFGGVKGLTSLQPGDTTQVIDGSTLPESLSNNYGISTWFFVSDWSTKYGQSKTVFTMGDNNNPSIVLGSTNNDILVNVECYVDGSTQTHQCVVQNFPLQKWVNCIVSLYGRSLDIYIDGKLVRTCVLPGTATIPTTKTITVTPDKGFSGYTSNIRYYPDAISPQDAYNIYKEGFGGSSWLSNLLNKYRLKIAFLKDNTEEASFEI